MNAWLPAFVAESNHIEGMPSVTTTEIEAHEELLAVDAIGIADMERFVRAVQPGAILRRKRGLNVRVGGYIAPPGGPAIEVELTALLATLKHRTPYEVHQAYEHLHPFTDGNGRSGRALWLLMMIRRGLFHPQLLFLHHWYYQSLEAARTPDSSS